jgi:hypothetical protein
MSDSEGVRLELTPGALEVVTAMQERVAAVAEEYGEGSPEHVEILKSLASALARVLELGGRITKDDELSLFGASYIAYGVILHPRAKAAGRTPFSEPGRFTASRPRLTTGPSPAGRGRLTLALGQAKDR